MRMICTALFGFFLVEVIDMIKCFFYFIYFKKNTKLIISRSTKYENIFRWNTRYVRFAFYM